MTDAPRKVTVLGLGAMGLPIATRLGETFAVAAFDPSSERLALAAAAGCETAHSAFAASRDADVVIVAVRDAAQADQALFGEGGAVGALRAGAVVVLTSTIGPEAVRGIGERLEPAGIFTVDAPVSGGSKRAGEGSLLVMVSGPAAGIELARPALERMAAHLEPVGDQLGDGQGSKIVNQLLCGVHIVAAAEALALADRLGLDLDRTLDILGKGAAASFMLADRGARMVLDAPRPIHSRLDIFVKDMGMVLESARGKVPVVVAAAAEQLYALAAEADLGAADDSELIDFLRGISAPDPTPTTED
jgi:3-hydroxyisobutyrate dehydrogenase